MPVDLINVSFPHIKTFSVSTTLTEIQLGSNARFVTIQSTKKLYLATNGTDGGAVGSDFFEIPASQPLELKMTSGSRNKRSIFVACHSATGNVNLLVEM